MLGLKDLSVGLQGIQRICGSTGKSWWIAIIVGALMQMTLGDSLTTWQYNSIITLNTSSTGANTSSTQYNFPVLIRLTSLNAAAIFASARSDGGDLRFSRPGTGDTSQLPYELNKYNAVAQTAYIWVKVDSLQGGNANQSINIWWGKPSATTTSDSANVFVPANGFAAVLHLNKRSTGTTLYDATGQGNNGTCSNTVTDTTGIFDSAVAMHCYGTSSSYLAGDSIVISGLLGTPSQLTLSAWVRVDSIDQGCSAWYGHRANIISLGDDVSMSDGGLAGASTDSLWAAWYGNSASNDYGWPSPSLTGTSVLGLSNNSGHAMWHQGWKYASIVFNPGTNGFVKIYLNGDSVRTLTASNALSWGAGGLNHGTRTVFGKHGAGGSGEKFGGSICESRIENVPRSSDWIRLCYQNQQPNDSLTGLSVMLSLPATPALALPLNGTVNEPTSMTLNWGAVTNAMSYNVMVSTAANFATTVSSQTNLAGTSASLSGLANNTQYFWEVNSVNISGTSAWSGAWSFTTIMATPAIPVLTTPTNGTVNASVFPTLTWGTVTNAAFYGLLVSTMPNFAATVWDQNGLTAASASLSYLTNSTQYYWVVNATNADGGTSAYSGPWSFTTIIAVPAVPALSSPGNATSNEPISALSLTWGAVTGAASYSLMVSTSASFATTISSQTGLTGLTAVLSGLANLTTYYWEVNATNVGGNSAWSSIWSFTTIMEMPTLASPANGSANEPTSLALNWGTVPGATSYSAMVSTAANFGTTVYSQIGWSGTTALLNGLVNSTTYYWIAAGNMGVFGTVGPWSSAWSFTTIIAAPAIPVLAAPTSGTMNTSVTPTLTWGTVTGAASYGLMVSTSASFTTTVSSQTGLTGGSALLIGLAGNTPYYWEVNAMNIGGTSNWSGIWSFTTNEDYTTWTSSKQIALNTSATGANTSTPQNNFPVLLRLTYANSAAFFASEAASGMNGADLRFADLGTGTLPAGTHLAYELNKINVAAQTALVWVNMDQVLPQNSSQAITMYWGNSNAVSQSDSANVFVPANGFATVLHLNKRSTGTTLYDATGQGRNGTCSNTVTDTTGIFDSAVAMHCYGTSSSYLAGDSITIAGLLGSPSQVTFSAWVRVDSIDQANTSANGHNACIISIGDYASLNDEGASGTGNDSLTAEWFGAGTQWNNYGWPSPSQVGTSQNGYSNTSGHSAWHQGWKHLAEVINPAAGYAKLYLNGDSVRMLPAANALSWTGGNNGKRTVIGKHGAGHAGQKFGGSICESRIETVPRSSDWIRLCYQNQQPNDSLTGLSTLLSLPAAPALASPLNGAINQPTSQAMTWEAVSGAASYSLLFRRQRTLRRRFRASRA